MFVFSACFVHPVTQLNTDLNTIDTYGSAYVNNQYVTSANVVDRIYIFKVGKVGVLHLNLIVSNQILAGASAATKIGTFPNLPTLKYGAIQTVTGQSQTDTSLLVELNQNGLTILNAGTKAASGWYRAMIPLMFT